MWNIGSCNSLLPSCTFDCSDPIRWRFCTSHNLWHVQNCDLIRSPHSKLELTIFSQNFNSELMNPSRKFCTYFMQFTGNSRLCSVVWDSQFPRDSGNVLWVRTQVNSFTVSLHNPNGRQLPAIRAVQGDRQWLCKMVEIPTGHMSLQCFATWSNPKLYLDQTITKGSCQPIVLFHNYIFPPAVSSPNNIY